MRRTRKKACEPDVLAQRAKEQIGSQKQALRAWAERQPAPPRGESGHAEQASRRVVQHRGHRIVIETHYEISIDGEPLRLHVAVDDQGRVHAHGLPNYAFASMVDLVEALIDHSSLEGELPRDQLSRVYDEEGAHGHA